MNLVERIEADPRWTKPRTLRARCAICALALDPTEHGVRPPCALCGAVTCARCASPCRPCALLAELRAVCAGEPLGRCRDTSVAQAATKLSLVVRTLGPERDVLFAGDRVVVRALGDHGYHGYLPEPGPRALRYTLRCVGITRLDRAFVAYPRHAGPSPTVHSRHELMWILPHEHGVELRFRRVPSEGMPAAPMEIPLEGAWALPPPWTPPRPQVVDGNGVPCAHCGCPSPLYRALYKAYVCPECGRSFASDVLDARPRTTR